MECLAPFRTVDATNLQLEHLALQSDEVLEDNPCRKSVFVIRNMNNSHTGHLEMTMTIFIQSTTVNVLYILTVGFFTHNVLLLGLLLVQTEHGHQGVALSGQRPKVLHAQLSRNVCMPVLNSVTADAGEAELKKSINPSTLVFVLLQPLVHQTTKSIGHKMTWK